MVHQVPSYSHSHLSLQFYFIDQNGKDFFKKTCLEKLSENDRPNFSLCDRIGSDSSIKAYLVYCNTIMCGVLLYQREVEPKITIHCLKQITVQNPRGCDVYTGLLEKVLSDACALGCRRIDAVVPAKDEQNLQFYKSHGFVFTLFPSAGDEADHKNKFLLTRVLASPAVTMSSKTMEQPLQKRTLENHEDRAPVMKKSKEEEGARQYRHEAAARTMPSASFHEDRAPVMKKSKEEGTSQYQYRSSVRAVSPPPFHDRAEHAQEYRPRSLSFSQVPYQKRPMEVTLKEPYLSFIRQGRKTIEGRIAAGLFQRVLPGTTIRFFNHTGSVTCKILSVKYYKSFDEMLRAEGVEKCLPNTRSMEEGVRIYNSIPGYRERAAQHGVVALHLQRE